MKTPKFLPSTKTILYGLIIVLTSFVFIQCKKDDSVQPVQKVYSISSSGTASTRAKEPSHKAVTSEVNWTEHSAGNPILCSNARKLESHRMTQAGEGIRQSQLEAMDTFCISTYKY